MMDSLNLKKWFPFESQQSEHHYLDTVFCFHHAGGIAATYRKWTIESAPVKFVCIELPGKGVRRKEEFVDDFNLLFDPLCEVILKKVGDGRFVLYGHSMGAAAAFYTAHRLAEKYQQKPLKLIVSGRQAPNEEDLIGFKTYMSDDALVRELKMHKGTPPEVFANREFLEVIIAELRKDYKLNESFVYRDEQIDIPIIAHAAKQDYGATAEIMAKWANMTTNSFVIEEFAGEHFFVLEEEYRDRVIEAVLRE